MRKEYCGRSIFYSASGILDQIRSDQISRSVVSDPLRPHVPGGSAAGGGLPAPQSHDPSLEMLSTHTHTQRDRKYKIWHTQKGIENK